MITKAIDDSRISVMPEEPDDLLALRRIIKKGDHITGDTTRVIKQDKDYARPDRGEKIRIRMSVLVERAALDSVLDRLRIHGTVHESSSEAIPHDSHHSLLIKPGDRITIAKKSWSPMQKKLIRSKTIPHRFVLVSIDTADCGIAKLHGTHIDITPNMYSGAGGKRYKTSFKIEKFLEQAYQAVSSSLDKDDKIIIFGPGQTKNRLANYLKERIQNETITVEGIDAAGEDGIHTFAKSAVMKEAISDSKLATVSDIIDRIMVLAGQKSRRFAMGMKDVSGAIGMGAVESLVFSDKIIQDQNEQEVIDLLNSAESSGSAVYGVDSSTDIGLRVTGLGGVVALLRYSIDA